MYLTLLHIVQWFHILSYNKNIWKNCGFVIKVYGSAIIAFDDYKSEPSTKDSTHYQCQRKSKKSSKEIAFSGEILRSPAKEEFLFNP